MSSYLSSGVDIREFEISTYTHNALRHVCVHVYMLYMYMINILICIRSRSQSPYCVMQSRSIHGATCATVRVQTLSYVLHNYK
jgi:hypothetical protein